MYQVLEPSSTSKGFRNLIGEICWKLVTGAILGSLGATKKASLLLGEVSKLARLLSKARFLLTS